MLNFTGATNVTFVDGPNTYNDTITGFSQAAGDSIHLTGSDTSSYAGGARHSAEWRSGYAVGHAQ